MSFINVYVSKPSKIFVKNKQLHVENEESDNVFSAEDVNCVLIESTACTITSHVMQFLAENGVVVFFCNEKHLPSSVATSFNTHHRQLGMLEMQQGVSKPLKKQLWQSIVKCKIRGQAKVLEKLGKPESGDLYALAGEVASGDVGNVEATAANLYFKAYFDGKNHRRDETAVNACLDYGYAIVRGLIARSLAAHGFIPCVGLFHHSSLNAFNLADDLIEPFRPIVDLWVATYVDEEEMTPQVKRRLFSLVNAETKINNANYTLSYAVDLFVESLKRSLQQESNLLTLPAFEDAVIHYYA